MKALPTVLNILFPQVRAEILRLLFCDPARQRYVRELTAMSGLALGTVQEELAAVFREKHKLVPEHAADLTG
jgi:hypothetical protein